MLHFEHRSNAIDIFSLYLDVVQHTITPNPFFLVLKVDLVKYINLQHFKPRYIHSASHRSFME